LSPFLVAYRLAGKCFGKHAVRARPTPKVTPANAGRGRLSLWERAIRTSIWQRFCKESSIVHARCKRILRAENSTSFVRNALRAPTIPLRSIRVQITQEENHVETENIIDAGVYGPEPAGFCHCGSAR